MLVLAAANGVGVVLFATVYAAAGSRRIGQGAFVACLVVLFALVTALWLRVEGRHAAHGPVWRVGRAVGGLVLVAVAVPALVLAPLFWLENLVPPEAGLNAVIAPAMAVLLIALVLVALVNLVGGLLVVLRGFLASGASTC